MSTTSTQGVIALSVSLVVCVTLFTGLRLLARNIQKSYGLDDYLTIPAWVCFIGMVACGIIGVHLHQFGYTTQEVAAYHLPFSVQAALVVSLDVLSTCSLGFSKISALLFYRRIFCTPGTSAFKHIIHILIAILSLWMISFIVLPPLQCGPDLRVWNAPSAVRTLRCKAGSRIILGFVISDFFLELVVITLPIPKILKLKTSVKRRLAVILVFLTAFVSFGAVVARLVIVSEILSKTIPDITLANTKQTFIWILEAGFALIAINMPSLWYLRHKIQPEIVLASIRSVISLQSIWSGSNQRSGDDKATQTTGDAMGKRRPPASADTGSDKSTPDPL